MYVLEGHTVGRRHKHFWIFDARRDIVEHGVDKAERMPSAVVEGKLDRVAVGSIGEGEEVGAEGGQYATPGIDTLAANVEGADKRGAGRDLDGNEGVEGRSDCAVAAGEDRVLLAERLGRRRVPQLKDFDFNGGEGLDLRRNEWCVREGNDIMPTQSDA